MNTMRFASRAGTTIDHRLNIRRRLFEYRNNQKTKTTPSRIQLNQIQTKNYRIPLTIN
ncbi:hypothetical protein QZM64_20225 [Burkholderia cepacia]|uniref:hypothetical protein n=1 Tax=Burkholderia cepacia TaxID=292 RepID=UPI0026502B1B|nr:hypothetical protein [Burkholderia cepacia]MDN7441494.1 hypothetical protein [Burkholderia cepacia]